MCAACRRSRDFFLLFLRFVFFQPPGEWAGGAFLQLELYSGFKAHPAASTALLVGSFQLAADSRLSTHSSSTLDLGSLSALETRDPAAACVDSEASSSTVALRKAFSMDATTQPHASSFAIRPLHRLWFYDPERAIGTSPRARPELRTWATPPRSCQPPSPTYRLAPGRNSWPEDGLWLVRWKICIHTKMFHRSSSPRSNCK